MWPSSAHLMNGRISVYREADRQQSSLGSSEATVSLIFPKGVSIPHLWSWLPAVWGLKILREKNRDRNGIIGPIRSSNKGPKEILPHFHSHGIMRALSSHKFQLGGAVSHLNHEAISNYSRGGKSPFPNQRPLQMVPKAVPIHKICQAPTQLSTMYMKFGASTLKSHAQVQRKKMELIPTSSERCDLYQVIQALNWAQLETFTVLPA